MFPDVQQAEGALSDYVTARFGAKGSKLSAKDVAELRKQTAE
jgi:hypothetical protein